MPLFQHGRLPVHGPLSVKPFSGLAQGTFTGVVFGAISLLPASSIPLRARFTGWVLVGAIMGFIIGLLAPAFRHRISATAVIWLSLSIALIFAGPYWQLADTVVLPGGAILLAAFGAITYGFLCWEYIADSHNESASATPFWPTIARALLRRLRSTSRPAD